MNLLSAFIAHKPEPYGLECEVLFKNFTFWFQPLPGERFLDQAGDVPAGQTPLWGVHFHRAQYPSTIRFTSPSCLNTSCPGLHSRHFSSQHQRLPCQLYSGSWRENIPSPFVSFFPSFLPFFLPSFLHGDTGLSSTPWWPGTNNKVTPLFHKKELQCLVKILFQSRIWVWNLVLKVRYFSTKWHWVIIETTLSNSCKFYYCSLCKHVQRTVVPSRWGDLVACN